MKIKLYRGKKRLANRILSRRGAYQIKLLTWALSVKPGDYVGTCEGCNRKVVEATPCWVSEGWIRRGRPNKTYVLDEVRFLDTHGRLHYCPGGGCAYPPETPEQVTNFFREWTAEAKEDEILQWCDSGSKATKTINGLRKMKEALESGEPIVDEHGELLPEFDGFQF